MSGPPGVGAKAGLAVQLLGAAMSLALIAGGGIWGYKLIVRDATGVPVVRAMEGPMRQAPGDPGGAIALNTGLSVNAVAAVGEAAPPEDVLVLAPPTPDLTVEDLLVMPTAEAGEMFPEDLAAEGGGVVEPLPEVALDAPAPDQPLSEADILALADAISAGATPLTALADAPVVASDLEAVPLESGPQEADAVEAVPLESGPLEAEVAEAPLTEVLPEVTLDAEAVVDPAADPAADAAALAVAAAVAEAAVPLDPEAEPVVAAVDEEGRLLRSIRPSGRPASLGTAAAVTPEAGTAQTFAVSTEEVPLGTTLVQLGAFDTPDLAGAEWTRLAGRFAAFMEGKTSLIQEATSGGRAFFRLRATGFVDIADARRFCSTLVAEGAACIPVVIQ